MAFLRSSFILLFFIASCAQEAEQALSIDGTSAPAPLPEVSGIPNSYQSEGQNLQSDGKRVEVSLSCLTEELVDEVIAAKDIRLAENLCAEELQNHFSNNLSDDEVTAVLSMVVAHNFAEYGASSALKYDQLITEERLDCDNYSALQGHLADEALQYSYVGFEGGSVGNHAQVYLEEGEQNRAMFLDPTVSIFAFVSFDDYLRGKKVDAYEINQQNFQIKSLNKFSDKVSSSFTQGKVKPSDLLYYYFDLEHRLGEVKWPYFTPGGEDLYNRQQRSAVLD